MYLFLHFTFVCLTHLLQRYFDNMSTMNWMISPYTRQQIAFSFSLLCHFSSTIVCLQWLVATLFLFLSTPFLLTYFRFVSHCHALVARICVCTNEKQQQQHTNTYRQPVTWDKWGFWLRFGTFHMHLMYGIMLFYIPHTRFLAQSTSNHNSKQKPIQQLRCK